MEEISIRDLIPDDSAFIIDSWLRSYFGHSYFAQEIPKAVFFRSHCELIKKLILRGSVKVAVKREDPDIILGYIAFEKEKLHYIYIKESFRGFGICRKLLMENNFFDGTIITHLTLRTKKVQLKMGYVYCPYFE